MNKPVPTVNLNPMKQQIQQLSQQLDDVRAQNSNHLDQAPLQLTREPGPLPRLEIRRRARAIDAYEYEDFVIADYVAQPHIAAPVAV